MKLENNLGTDAIRPLVLRIAIPSMLAQFVSVLYSIVDRIYISNIPVIGETALAGVGIELLDHLVFVDGDMVSMRDSGMMK